MIESLTLGELREVARMFSGASAQKPCPFVPGAAYLIRTVTHYWTGRVREQVGDFLVLDSAAWIPDTGRYSQATTEGALKEVEPVGDGVIVGLGAVVDARPWSGTLPTVLR
jgi:hypothetical protein